MSNPIFNNSRDKNDFLIALGVIGFFLWLFLFSGIFGEKKSLASVMPTKAAVIIDTDEDGLIDSIDECPELYARTVTGCPSDIDATEVHGERTGIAPVTTDVSGDNARNDFFAGKNAKDCCKDPNKKCDPATCPKAKSGTCDPSTCPKAKDGKCKSANTAGKKGCVHDSMKENKMSKGVIAPVPVQEDTKDTDNDGVIDSKDACPEVAGVPENDGCPKLVLEKEETDVISEAIRNVQFEYGSDRLTAPSKVVLDKVVKLMEKYKDARLFIEGHTDNDSSSEFNLKLSQDRANSSKNYLVSKGIAASRITAKGFGETKPIATNETEEGRTKNRRVEFTLR